MKHKIIHIGSPKSGSTTLQRELFMKHPKIHYFGEEGEGCYHNTDRNLLWSLYHDDDIFYDRVRTKQLFTEHFTNESPTVIFSDVDIMSSRQPSIVAQRLYELEPEAKIFIIVRNQFDVIKSYYVNHGSYLKPSPEPHFRKHIPFRDWMDYCLRFKSQSPLMFFKYKEIIDIYTKLFGSDKINVVAHETMIYNPEAFYRYMDKLLQIEDTHSYLRYAKVHRPRQPKRNLFISKCISLLPLYSSSRDNICQMINNLTSILPNFSDDIEFSESDKRQLRAFYRSGNSRLVTENKISITETYLE